MTFLKIFLTFVVDKERERMSGREAEREEDT